MNTEINELNTVDFFKCLAEDTRLKTVLLILKEQELCVCELMAALEDNQPKISRHLSQMRTTGVVQDRRQGQWVYYSIHPKLPEWAKNILSITLENNYALIKDCHNKLTEMGNRPERKKKCC